MNDFSMILSMTRSSTMLAPRWFDRRQEGLGFQDHKNSNNNDKKQSKSTMTSLWVDRALVRVLGDIEGVQAENFAELQSSITTFPETYNFSTFRMLERWIF
jgi:hypothetical protein